MELYNQVLADDWHRAPAAFTFCTDVWVLLGLHLLHVCKWALEGLAFKIMFTVFQINVTNVKTSAPVLVQSVSQFEVKK